MPKFLQISLLTLLMVALSGTLSFITYPEVDDETYYQKFKTDYGIYALKIPRQFSVFNESVPMDDPQVREFLDRELLVNTYWQSNTLLYLKRAAKHFPVIEPILRKNGIPEDFKYLPLIESGFLNVVSPAGAVGKWQIMEETGKERGLEINSYVDERYHLEKSTQVACDYLRKAHQELGSWTLAAAAYNAGVSGIKNQLERQNTNSYYGLTLNTETARYLYRIMAAKKILSNPEQHGFYLRNSDTYKQVPTLEVNIDSTITHFKYLINKYGINYRILKYHNPWLRQEKLPNPSGKTYTIKIPRKGYYELAQREQQIEMNSLAEDSTTAAPPEPMPADTGQQNKQMPR